MHFAIAILLHIFKRTWGGNQNKLLEKIKMK